jgi:hypothetical protein
MNNCHNFQLDDELLYPHQLFLWGALEERYSHAMRQSTPSQLFINIDNSFLGLQAERLGAAHDLHAGDAGARAAVACRVHSRTMVMRLMHDSAGTWRPDMIEFIFSSRMNSGDPEIANRIYLPTQQQEVIATRRSEKNKTKTWSENFHAARRS